MTKKKEEAKTPKTKDYIATVTARIGSNTDGSAKFNFKQGESISLTFKEAKRFHKYIE